MKTIHLLSKSPRRIALLSQAGVHTVRAESAGDEPTPARDETPEAYCLRAAQAKFLPAVPEKDALYLAADTVVAVDSTILGKPADQAEARRMLERLSGRTHTVITAVVAGTVDSPESWAAVSTVQFSHLTEDAYARILADTPTHYAGAYAIQGAAGQFATVTEGNTSTVIGLPVEEVKDWLLRQ